MPQSRTTAGPVPPTIVAVMGAMVVLGPLTVDTYLPALPAIRQDLDTTTAAVQLTLTGTLVGMSVGQLVIGPLSDLLGRRIPLLAGIAVHVLASLLITLPAGITTLGLLRVLQGFGAAAASVICTAMVRDLAEGSAAATLLSRMMLMIGVAPVLAPTLGVQILRVSSWQGIFLVLAALGAALFALALVALPESLPAAGRRSRLSVRGTAAGYGQVLRDGPFCALALVTGLSMAALFGYVAAVPFVLREQYRIGPNGFALSFAISGAVIVAATQLPPFLLRRYQPGQVLLAALTAGCVGAVLLLGLAISGAGGLIGLLSGLWLVLAAIGVLLPTAPAMALTRHAPQVAGSAAAVLGATQFGLAALVPPLVGWWGADATAMAAVMLMHVVAALVLAMGVVRPSPWTCVEA